MELKNVYYILNLSYTPKYLHCPSVLLVHKEVFMNNKYFRETEETSIPQRQFGVAMVEPFIF